VIKGENLCFCLRLRLLQFGAYLLEFLKVKITWKAFLLAPAKPWVNTLRIVLFIGAMSIALYNRRFVDISTFDLRENR